MVTCLVSTLPTIAAEPDPLRFSELPLAEQRAIERRLAPPPLEQRDNPYSTPMYYLMTKGYYDGINNEVLLKRNRPDWQEAIIRDWVELGLTSVQAATTPREWDDPHTVQAYRDLFDLCDQYGLRVGMRLMGDQTLQGIEAEGWEIHPRNPENRLDDYVAWVGRMAEAGKGVIQWYVVGDEVNSSGWEASTGDGRTVRGNTSDERRWTPEVYMEAFRPIAAAIREADPDARVSMFGMNGMDLTYVHGLFAHGFGEHGDGIAANIDFGRADPEKIDAFVSEVRKLMPDAGLYSNGVGYVGASNTDFNPVNHGSPLYSDEAQAIRIARIMFLAFAADWDCAPYYICLRRWVLPDGTTAPHWYGYFGFLDYQLDEHDNLTVKRFPGWYAFQTVAHVFHSQSALEPPAFTIDVSPKPDGLYAFERDGEECLIVLWNDGFENESNVSIDIASDRYTYPVQVDLFNYRMQRDLPYSIRDGKIRLTDVPVGESPVIIRLVAEKQRYRASP